MFYRVNGHCSHEIKYATNGSWSSQLVLATGMQNHNPLGHKPCFVNVLLGHAVGGMCDVMIQGV